MKVKKMKLTFEEIFSKIDFKTLSQGKFVGLIFPNEFIHIICRVPIGGIVTKD